LPKTRRKHTVSQAKNTVRRTIKEIVDPGPRDVDPLWAFFESRCAYCGKSLSRASRDAHVDHADVDGGNHLGNLVLACGACNGDEKREEPWRQFLRRTVRDDATFIEREQRILTWLAQNPRSQMQLGPEAERMRLELEKLVEEFAARCVELKRQISTTTGL
jgi:5-methylcytosine-specific restriction endonuclease McrA